MVRIASKSRRSVLPTVTAKAAPPRVRMCVSWRVVLLGLICLYASGMVVVIFTLDAHHPSTSKDGTVSNDPLGILQQDLSKLVHDVGHQMEQLENEFLAWTGWETAKNQEDTEILSSVSEINHLYKVEKELELKYPDRNPRLCRRLHQDSIELRKNNLTWNDHDKPLYALDILSSCHELNPTKEYYLYNPFQQDRLVCGFHVPAQGVVKIKNEMWHSDNPPEFCIHTSNLYGVLPDKTARGLKPPVVKDNVAKCVGEYFKECDVPCQKCGNYALITSRTIEGTPFNFIFSMEGESYYPKLKVDPFGWTKHQYTATTDFSSDIPLPYFSFAEYDIQNGNEPVDFDKGIKGALFLARNCNSHNDREGLVKRLQDLSSIFRIDSVSSCLHNAEPPNGVSRNDKTLLMRQYLFYLSLENQNTKDYVTEKLWGAFVAGVIPIYKGAPNIKQLVPGNSVIFADDFSSARDLASYLQKVANDRSLYESYHAWRYQPLPPHFMQKYNMTKTHNVCRTCRWAYAKKYGLGWAHEEQQLVDLQIPRHACRDVQGMLTWPVRERWFQSTDTDDEMDHHVMSRPILCTPTERHPWEASEEVARHWERTLHEHDGVVDLKVSPLHHHYGAKGADEDFLKHPIVLELGLPFDDNDKTLAFRQIESGHLQWQNRTARVTIFIKPPENTPIRRTNPTTVQIKHPTAIRIMVEDVDRFHVDAFKEASYFGSRMKEEWEKPLEIFMVEAGN